MDAGGNGRTHAEAAFGIVNSRRDTERGFNMTDVRLANGHDPIFAEEVRRLAAAQARMVEDISVLRAENERLRSQNDMLRADQVALHEICAERWGQYLDHAERFARGLQSTIRTSAALAAGQVAQNDCRQELAETLMDIARQRHVPTVPFV